MDSHVMTFEPEFILPTLDIDFEITGNDSSQDEEFDFPKLNEAISLSEKDEIVSPYDPNVHLPSNMPNDFIDNYISIIEASQKDPQVPDCDMDWLNNLFDNPLTLDQSDTSVKLPEGSEISRSSNFDYDCSYSPDLFDIVNESFHFGEQPITGDTTRPPVINGEFILSNVSESRSTSQFIIESNLKCDTNISKEHQKKICQITPNFPSKSSIFNIKESQNMSESEDAKNLTITSEISSTSPTLFSYENFAESLETNIYDTKGSSIHEKPLNNLLNNKSKPTKQFVYDNALTNEEFQPIQPTSFILPKLFPSKSMVKNPEANNSVTALEKSRNCLISNTSIQAKQMIQNNGLAKEFIPIQQISNPLLSSADLPKQINSTLKYPPVMSKPTSSMLNVHKNSNSQVVKQSVPVLFLVNDGRNQSPNISTNYQILCESKCNRINSSLNNVQNFLLLSNNRGEQTLMLYNNQEVKSSSSSISNTLPTSAASTTVFANVQNTEKITQFLNISYAATSQNCAINKIKELRKNTDMSPICVKNNEPFTSSNKSLNPSMKVIYPNINKSTSMSVIPLMPLGCAAKKSSGTNNNQHRVALLRKLRASSTNGSKPSLNAKSSCKSQFIGVSPVSNRTGQRRKTVRELLLERQRNKLFESLVQSCVSNSNEVHTTNDSRSMNVPLKITGTSKSTVKPSILMLRSEKGDLNKVKEIKPNAFMPKVDLPISHDRFSFHDKSLNLNVEDDVDDPGVDSSTVSAPTTNLTRRNSRRHHQKPRHFDMYYLEIGDFKVEDAEVEKVRCKFKVLFAKRQFVYEFPLYNNGTSVRRSKMARLNIPFNVVSAINCFNQDVYLKVNIEPQVFIKAVKEKLGIDIIHCETTETTGAMFETEVKCSIHRIVLGESQGNKLKACLLNYDPIFYTLMGTSVQNEFSLLHLPLKVGSVPPASRSNVLTKRLKKDRRLGIRQLPQVDICGENSLFTLQVCSCKISCRSYRCSCVKAAQKCNTGRSVCVCSNCDNPLNILDTLGIDPICAVLDSCLFQNIYQVTYLHQYLSQEIKLPCCSYTATIQECIPGTVLCPNMECMESIQYSWCLNLVCSAERNPRNHCSTCGKCRFSIGIHCDKCKSCYVKNSKSSCCSKCTSDSTAVANVNNMALEELPSNDSSAVNEDILQKITEDI